MEIGKRKNGDVSILDLNGNIKTAEELEIFTTSISDILAEGCTKILLNFSKVNFITSSGLGRLVLALKKVEEVSGALKVTNLVNELDELFTYTRLKEKIPVYKSEEEALSKF